MSNPLSPKVTRQIVREWLDSKSDVLHSIIREVADVLTPIAAEAAGSLVLSSIDPDPREALLEDFEQLLYELLRWFTDVQAADPESTEETFWRGIHCLEPRLQEAWAHLVERRRRMRDQQFPAPIAPAPEGGAA